MSLAEVSAMFQVCIVNDPRPHFLMTRCAVQERFGYSLHVAESSISHPEAGMGLWLRGHANSGDVVGLFPGVCYAPIHYRSHQQPSLSLSPSQFAWP